MLLNQKILLAFFFCLGLWQCGDQAGRAVPTASQDVPPKEESSVDRPGPIIVGAARFDAYLPKLKNQKVGMLVNQTSMVGDVHLVDTLLALGVDIRIIFAPEHGFRGEADAGEKVADGKDTKTGLTLKSLYGKNRKPTAEDLRDLDVIVFDVQDVGARFYTYISSMHYMMQACAEQNVNFLVLDRPNPNGHYVDGPILDMAHSSFIGMHPVPVVHGMTVAEYARMINGENWLGEGLRCDLDHVACQDYDHQRFYELPVRPSPNLPNMRSIYLYPSLCFFEGTVVSIGRGTQKQFQVIGHPSSTIGEYTFVPESMPGAKYPKLQGEKCRGHDLSDLPLSDLQEIDRLDLSHLLAFYEAFPNRSDFFLKNKFIDKLAGGTQLREQILTGQSEEDIRQSWAAGLEDFRKLRKPYLLYAE
ncbi:MAG: DUF1343 domain-containing protein [Bacteroidota bacterium]